MADTMQAVVRYEYGTPDVVQLKEIDMPVVGDGQVLVRVRAAGVNPLDWHRVTGTPYVMRRRAGLRRPKDHRLGVDYAGTIEAVGAGVTGFRPGDDVFGGRDGAFAEYVCASPAGSMTHKPSNLTFEEAAAVPIAAITALQALRDHGALQPGQSVLINGASGGVGTFAVQIAKAFGADVTGVCSTRNVDLVRSLGADHVIDYTREDFTRGGRRYDVLLDNVGNRSWWRCRRLLKPAGRFVPVGGPKGRLLGGLGHTWRTILVAKLGGARVDFFLANITVADMVVLRELLETGKVSPCIDRRYRLDDIAEALLYQGQGHARGKVVITM